MKKIILAALSLSVGIVSYGQNYMWSSHAYGAITNCSSFTNEYTPVETHVNDDYSLLSGGESSGSNSCDPGFGGIDIKIVKSNIIGGIDYIKKIGTSGDDRLVKILDDSHGNNILIGNTVSGGTSNIFIITLDANGMITSENTLQGATVLDAEKVGKSPIGFYGSIHLTGVEDDRMFYSELLVGSNNNFFEIVHKTLNRQGTKGKSIEVSPYNNQFRVLIADDYDVWTITPQSSNPAFDKVYLQSTTGRFTTIETKGNEILLGTDDGELMICDINLTNVQGYFRYGINQGGPGGYKPVSISDIEITSNNEIIASGIMSVYGSLENVFFRTDMTGSILGDGKVGVNSQNHYEKTENNRFDLDAFNNICVNYGLRITIPQGFTYLQYEQERLVFVNRLDQDFTDNCSWNPLGLAKTDLTGSAIFPALDPSYNSTFSAGSFSYSNISNGNYSETDCESSNCVSQAYEYAQAYYEEPDPNGGPNPIKVFASEYSVGEPHSNLYYDWGFNIQSGSQPFFFDFPAPQYFQVTYVIDGITYTWDINDGYPIIFPYGVYSFTLLVIDQNGCPYFTEYSFPNYAQSEPHGRFKSTGSEAYSDNLSAYPNPTNGELNLTVSTDEFNQIIIHDLTGRVVKEINLTNEANQVVLDLTDQPSGIYMVTAIGNETRKSIKISKQ